MTTARAALARATLQGGQNRFSKSQKNLNTIRGYVQKSLVDILDRGTNIHTPNVNSDDERGEPDKGSNNLTNQKLRRSISGQRLYNLTTKT